MLGKVEICGVNTADLKVLSSDACRALLIRAKHGCLLYTSDAADD